jgi:DNA polymerase-3 subunit alpha
VCNKRVFESLIAAGALDQLDGHRAQLNAGLESALGEAQLRQAERSAGQASLFGDQPDARPATGGENLPDVPAWSEADRLTKEKNVIGFFISGHPLERFREEVQLLSTRTTATLGTWSEHQVSVAVVVTTVNRRVSKKTGSEYARLMLEDFHGTAEALVFPETWSKLSDVVVADSAMLLTGSYSARDKGEDRVPFIVEEAKPLDALRDSGALGVEIVWSKEMTDGKKVARGLAALCAAHPGPAPVSVAWSDGDGTETRLRARRIRVAIDDSFLTAVRELTGRNRVRLVKAR